MNVYEENQTSGNFWPVFSAMEPSNSSWDSSPSSEPWIQAPALEEFEAQVSQHESEHGTALSELRKHYVIPEIEAVPDFLNDHRALPPLLLEAVPQLKSHFGSNVIFGLRTRIDESGSQTLYAVVMWPGMAEAARGALDAFDDGWWGANSRSASAYLAFTYELV